MTNEQSGRAKGRVTFIAAAAVVALIVVLAIVVGIIFAVRGSDNRAPVAAASPTATSTSGPASTTESACGREVAYTRSDDLEAAPATKWKSQGPAKIASSPAAGGFKDDSGYWSCYARTAEGALYATYNAAQYCADTTLAARALPETIADGPGKAAAAAAAKSIDSPCTPLSPTGFRIQSYDGTNATVYLLVTTATGDQGAAGFNLVWQHGDWKIEVDASGNNPIAAVPVQSSDGYTPWGPTNG